MNNKVVERPRETSKSLPIALLRAREAVMARFRPLLAERGFTEQQWRVLRVLDEAGPLDATQIAEKSVILTPSITRILKTLEDRQMINRASHPSDGRRMTITISKKARHLVADAVSGSNAIYAEIEQIYGKRKLNKLLEMLEEISKIAPR